MITAIYESVVQGKPGATQRSSQWTKVRKDFLLVQNTCQACGGKVSLNVHHIKPFHLFPELELVQSNLITLCEGAGCNCHFTFGHLLDWKSYNLNVREDCSLFLSKKLVRPYL